MSNSLGTPQYGFINKVGQVTENGLLIDRLVRATPPIYNVSCIRCSTSFQCSHAKVSYETCPNGGCGKVEQRHSHMTVTSQVNTAIRSRDSQEIRKHRQQEQQQSQPVSWTAEPNFEGADPDSIRRYLDWRDSNA